MNDDGANLPGDVLARVALRKQEALEAGIQALEERISIGIEGHLAERRGYLDGLTETRRKESESTGLKELEVLQAAGDETLRRLDTELVRRRSERTRDETRRREDRLVREKKEEEARKRQAEDEERKKKAATDDPSAKIRTLLKHAQNHMQRGDMELAAKVITEGLELDGFNAELLDLDEKIREAMASDTFTAKPTSADEAKKEKGKEKGKEKPAKAKQPKSKPAKQPPSALPPGAPGQRKFPSWAFTVIAAGLLVVAAAIVYIEYMPKKVEKNLTIAVLPWSSSADAKELKLFTDALPEVVVRLLSGTPSGVSVVGYATSANLSSAGSDPVGELTRLGYSHFLRGALSRRDTLFTVHVELSDSAGTTLWSQDFERDTSGLLLIPHEIAYGLRTHFRVATPPGAGTAVQNQNTEAYLLYLKGLNAMRQPGGIGVDEAVNTFNRSLALDSALAETHSGLSSALVARNAVSRPGAGDILEDAGAAASTAIRLDPRSSEGYAALGRVLIERHQYQTALDLLDSAEVRAPGGSALPYLRGMALFRSGRPEQALEFLQKAYRLDPRNVEILALMATVHYLNRTFDRALWFHETAMQFTGDTLRYLAGPLSDVIMSDAAIRLSQGHRVTTACMNLLGDDPHEVTTLYSLARLLQVTGDLEESNKYLKALDSTLRARVRSNPTDAGLRLYLGLTLTRLGRYADGIALGEAVVAADTNNVDAKYFLARIYALQMYSPQTRMIDSTKMVRTMDLLTEAINQRFIDGQLCNADLYNVYSMADIRSIFGRRSAER